MMTTCVRCPLTVLATLIAGKALTASPVSSPTLFQAVARWVCEVWGLPSSWYSASQPCWVVTTTWSSPDCTPSSGTRTGRSSSGSCPPWSTRCKCSEWRASVWTWGEPLSDPGWVSLVRNWAAAPARSGSTRSLWTAGASSAARSATRVPTSTPSRGRRSSP